MNAELLNKTGSHQLFLELTRRRRKARITMVALMLLVFVSTQLIWALFPEVIGLRLPANSPVSLGVWFTVLTVLCAIALSGVYSLILTKPLDALNEQLIREINRHAH